jgi:predicted unusual protein kinase regulating ubiquinone biosynthesis (AarF/ABC1/UbiB family)
MWADGKIYLLDLGMVGELGPQTREWLLLLLMAFWQGDTSFLAEIVLLLAGGQPPPDLNVQLFEEELAELLLQYREASLNEIQLGPILQGMTQIAARHDVRLPASLALAGKAFAQMQLAAARLDPELDPFAVIGDFLRRGFVRRFRRVADPKRVMYEAEKLKTRLERLTDAFERVIGSRPGAKLQVDFRGMEPLERTIRSAGRRMALGMAGGSAAIAAGITAASSEVGEWVPISFAGAAGFFGLLLLADLRRRY